MTPDLPRPDDVGGRAGAIGASAHLNDQDDGLVVAAIAVCTFLGFTAGLIVGLVAG